MAKHDPTPPALPENPTRISWPSEGGPKLSGAAGNVAIGKRVCLEIEGMVTGYSMRDWGCDIELKAKTVSVEALGDEDDGPKLTDMIDGLRKRTKKG